MKNLNLKLPVDFSETNYLLLNPDVSDALNKNELISATQHYLDYGFQEGRHYKIPDDFDEINYLLLNPDVSDALNKNELLSAAQHYLNHGYIEGRDYKIPDDFDEENYLLLNPDVSHAVRIGKFESGLKHFLNNGKIEGRQYKFAIENDSLGGGIWPESFFKYPYSFIDSKLKVIQSAPSLNLPNDLLLIKNITRSYLEALSIAQSNKSSNNGGMWDFLSQYYYEIDALIEKKDFERLALIFSSMFTNDFTYGLGMSNLSAITAIKYEKSWSNMWCDRLLRMAEAVGIVNTRSIEQAAPYDAPLELDVKLIMSQIFIAIGCPQLQRLDVGAIYGVNINDSIWTIRDFEHMLAAYKIKNFLCKITDSSVMELGGGYGGLAYWLYILGIRNITIFDLPQSNLAQAYFLNKALPYASIYTYQKDLPINWNAEIKILPYWEIENCEHNQFNLSVNQDALPEFPEEIGLKYLQNIVRVTNKYFLSINQEAQASHNQTKVFDMVKKVSGFTPFYRCEYWTRPGYIEEFFCV